MIVMLPTDHFPKHPGIAADLEHLRQVWTRYPCGEPNDIGFINHMVTYVTGRLMGRFGDRTWVVEQ